MITLAEVRLWGRTIGAVEWNNDTATGAFEYAPEFLRSGIQPSPLTMPLEAGAFRFPGLARETFMGLPGMLADALPDKFGNLLIDQWLAAQGRSPGSFNPVERLLYMGSRGMGALEFTPALDKPQSRAESLEIAELVSLANDALSRKQSLQTGLKAGADRGADSLRQIIAVGTSAGGARAKAVVAWNRSTGEVRSGQCDAPAGFTHYLLKFDGVSGNGDKELADPLGFTRIEYACYLLAKKAGIEMMASHLLEENGRAHFMTQRFDRTETGGKLHMQTLCGIAHYDFNVAGAYSYEQCFRVIRQLLKENSKPALEEQYRRMLLNIMIRNQDDHTKNIAFLMDRRGQWRLSPAYDVTYAYNPDGAWTHSHQMSVNGKRDNFTRDDLLQAAVAADLRPRQAEILINEVSEALDCWLDCAAQAGVRSELAERMQTTFRMF